MDYSLIVTTVLIQYVRLTQCILVYMGLKKPEAMSKSINAFSSKLCWTKVKLLKINTMRHQGHYLKKKKQFGFYYIIFVFYQMLPY